MSIRTIIESLPETVKTSDLQNYFDKLIIEFKEHNIELGAFLKLLNILVDKQWHNYEIAPQSVRSNVETLLMNLLLSNLNLEDVDNIGEIIGGLGLQKAYEQFKQLGNTTSENKMRELVDSYVIEYGPDISDPYSKFWN